MSPPKLGTSMDIERTIFGIEGLERLSAGSACLSAGRRGKIHQGLTVSSVPQESIKTPRSAAGACEIQEDEAIKHNYFTVVH